MSQLPVTRICEKCGQPVVADETACLACGAPLQRLSETSKGEPPAGLCLVTPAGKWIATLSERLTIGRDADNDLRLHDHEVSRHHAVIERVPAGWQITDLKSTNGVWLNGHRINGAALLQEWDRLIIGKIQMRLEKR